MAEMNFYINDIERKKLFNFLTLDGSIIIPDLMYETDKFEIVNSDSEFIEIIENKTVQFFICNNLFSKQELVLSQNRYIETPAFSVNQRYGGPYITLGLYRGYADDAKVKLKRTDLHHYPQYINIYNNYEEFKASIELKEYYNKIGKFLKSMCKNVTIDGKKYWVSRQALKEMEIE